jgi:hypothetical protein
MKQGKANGNATSCWSPYADQLLIPQLRELAGDYGLDGACVDGKALPFEYRNGSVELAIPSVAIHEAIVIYPQ